ncbi:MAG: hypothetical protein ACRC7O_18415, partial [Fimbriiglobus sp.]
MRARALILSAMIGGPAALAADPVALPAALPAAAPVAEKTVPPTFSPVSAVWDPNCLPPAAVVAPVCDTLCGPPGKCWITAEWL